MPRLSRTPTKLLAAPRDQIESEWAETQAYGANILCSFECHYPNLLKQHPPPPPVLTTFGNVDLLNRRCVAIVGARQASAAGRKLARTISESLSKSGFVIVSGLARGIDGEAHVASLDGGTIAVLAGGIDHIYPPQHESLYQAIAENSLLISESAFGHRATARDFPRRNRIITGLCEGVVIIEAAERSGSLISARTALEQNREVMAVPGSPLETRSAGSNRLIREGAVLIRSADDVLEVLNAATYRSIKAPPPPPYLTEGASFAPVPNQQIDAVKSALSLTPTSIEEIARAANIGVTRCATILVELEIEGFATTYAGGFASMAL